MECWGSILRGLGRCVHLYVHLLCVHVRTAREHTPLLPMHMLSLCQCEIRVCVIACRKCCCDGKQCSPQLHSWRKARLRTAAALSARTASLENKGSVQAMTAAWHAWQVSLSYSTEREDTVSMALTAVQRMLDAYGISPDRIGRCV